MLTPLRYAPVLIFCCALAVRLAYLAQDSSSPFFRYRGIDAEEYHQMAIGLTNGTWPAAEAFFWPPLYPLFLGLLYKTLGHGYVTLKIVQSLIGSATCVLVYFVARRVFGGRFVPLVAALVCCVYGTLIYFDGQLLSANLDIFLQLLVVLLVLLATQRGRPWWWALAGSCAGLSAINRGGILLFLPVIVVWMYAASRGRSTSAAQRPGQPIDRPLWKNAAAFLLPVAFVILPVTWHNLKYDRRATPRSAAVVGSFVENMRRLASGRFVLIASNVGLNFYLGNHWELRDINNVSHPECFTYYNRIKERPWAAGVNTASGHSRYLIRQTLSDIGSRPLDFLRLMGLKLFRLVNGAEISRNTTIYADRQYSSVLKILLWKKLVAFPSGLLIPLALVGILLARRCGHGHWLLVGCLAAQSIFILAFFVTARYRVASVPLLAIYGAYAVKAFSERIGNRRYRDVAVASIVLAGLVCLSNARIGPMQSDHWPFEHYDLALALSRQGKIDQAIAHYRRALSIRPDFEMAHHNLAKVLAGRGDFQGAIKHFSEALRIKPDLFQAHYNLGIICGAQGKTQEAIAHYRQALRINPDFDKAHNNLGIILAGQGKTAEAIVHFRKALGVRPDNAEAHNNLANALASQGRVDQAIAHYLEALRLKPDYARAHNNLGVILARRGQTTRAIAHFRQALRINPNFAEARRNLGMARRQLQRAKSGQ